MSDCQRWEPLDDSTMHQSADGGWVLIGDYSCLKREAHILRLTCQDLQSENARLKAEVERLDTLCKQLMAQHSDISCENIMLRKAGDELHAFLINYIVESRISSAYLNKLDDDWNAAKEGKGQP